MLRIENLIQVYNNFPDRRIEDIDSLKHVNYNDTNNPLLMDVISMYMLIDAERFFSASMQQLISARELRLKWFFSWAEVTEYYSLFFIINSILRLCGIAIVNKGGKTIQVNRISNNESKYSIQNTKGSSDHRKYWNLYYELIQNNIIDSPLIKSIFDLQIKFKHSEREFRSNVNYDLDFGFDERHHSDDSLKDREIIFSSMMPFENYKTGINNDYLQDTSIVVAIWMELKYIFLEIAKNTGFKRFWEMQIYKNKLYYTKSPIDGNIKKWILQQY